MKSNHLLICLVAVLFCSACSKDDADDAFGGYTEPSDQVLDYMTNLANKLVTLNLQELETALSASQADGMGRYFYRTNGKALTEEGAVWTLTREGDLYGLVISRYAGQDNCWTMAFDGDFKLDRYSYPTAYTMTVTAADASVAAHRSWDVVLVGERHEKEGYWCAFASDGPIQYRSLSEDKLWNAYGYLLMTVYEDDTKIDRVVMQLKGGKSDSVIAHIE